MMIDLIVCDLVPLRERGKFMGMIYSPSSVLEQVLGLI